MNGKVYEYEVVSYLGEDVCHAEFGFDDHDRDAEEGKYEAVVGDPLPAFVQRFPLAESVADGRFAGLRRRVLQRIVQTGTGIRCRQFRRQFRRFRADVVGDDGQSRWRSHECDLDVILGFFRCHGDSWAAQRPPEASATKQIIQEPLNGAYIQYTYTHTQSAWMLFCGANAVARYSWQACQIVSCIIPGDDRERERERAGVELQRTFNDLLRRIRQRYSPEYIPRSTQIIRSLQLSVYPSTAYIFFLELLNTYLKCHPVFIFLTSWSSLTEYQLIGPALLHTMILNK